MQPEQESEGIPPSLGQLHLCAAGQGNSEQKSS
jgi:hypothetical protein